MKHLAFPLRVTPTGLATVVQDSADDIAQSIQLLLRTRPGERRSVPDYGLPDPTFGTRLDEDDVLEAISEWEDRAVLDDLDLEQLVTVRSVDRFSTGFGEGAYGDGYYGGAPDGV